MAGKKKAAVSAGEVRIPETPGNVSAEDSAETPENSSGVELPEVPSMLSSSDRILRGRAALEARTAYLDELLHRLEQAHQRAILELRPEQAEAFSRNALAVEVLRELRNTMLADIALGQRIHKRLAEEG